MAGLLLQRVRTMGRVGRQLDAAGVVSPRLLVLAASGRAPSGGCVGDHCWTDVLVRAAATHDLVITYWVQNTARRQTGILMLNGHIDAAQILAARPFEPASGRTTWQRMRIFMEPFSWDAWLGIFGLILLNSTVRYLIEWRKKDKHRCKHIWKELRISWFEAAYSFVWCDGGGIESPAAAMINLSWGFAVLVIISLYTSQLTTFLTISAGQCRAMPPRHVALPRHHTTMPPHPATL
jgi:hypothetical protein